ncbi:MAG: hypothetical protein II478_02785, partial [Bacteroidales bacterium]|nr:hypothetical protein [Bacteroidales bacterium]
FVCSEAVPTSVELAAFGAEKGTAWVNDAMEYYEGRAFVQDNGERAMTPMPIVMGEHLRKKYQWTPIESLSEFDPDPSKFCVLPLDWFGAHPSDPENGTRYHITANTHSIHHYANSWTEAEYQGGLLHKWFYKIFGIDWRMLDRTFKLYGKK